jgi:hypothetical protein
MLLLGLLALAIIPATASAAPVLKLKAAKHKRGPYVNAPGPNPVTANVNEPKNFWVKAFIVPHSSVEARLFEQVANQDQDYKFKWYKGQNDISHDVQTSGHLFTLRHDHPKRFRVRVRPQVPNPGPLCLFPYVSPEGSLTQYEAFFAINGDNACV